MADITLKEIAHSYTGDSDNPDDFALKKLDLTWKDGGAYALLGPSGCGKTTLLNIISGLLTPTRGQILFGDKDVTKLPTAQRDIAQIFQFPVIYDTMTVYDNLAFPLKNRGRSAAEIKPRVEEMAEMLDLSRDLHTKAQHLTADAKQKISLGRGLIRRQINAILFDEPLTVIDPQLKWQLRSKLKQLHKKFNFTMIYVTHDQTEALTFADEVVVVYEGHIVQVGTPKELFEHPAHTFVGYFIGSPGMNFIPCTITGNKAIVCDEEITLTQSYSLPQTENIKFGIRPEHMELAPAGSPGLPVDIIRCDDVGCHRVFRVDLHGNELNVVSSNFAGEGKASLQINPEYINIYADELRVAGDTE